MDYSDAVKRIEAALSAAREAMKNFTPGKIQSALKEGGDPVTEADVLLDAILKKALLRDGEGWLSEETGDDLSRLGKSRVWIVDPLDGTREFIEGIPEWCISIAYVVDGFPQAAGICNPAANQTFLGIRDCGVTLNSRPVKISQRQTLNGATVLASRSEVKRGQWKLFENAPFKIIPTGSVAYKMACVAAGLYDATFTLVPKNEWDVAAGWLMVEAAGGKVLDKNARPRRFNQQNPLLDGLFAANSVVLGNLLDIEEVRHS
ncbi:MAG: 3'(2'),5'-bisphosphate nucleotidase CysQ [Planctomycetales bacterium]|nr:3'(2'),5'-bisphosphate nucleotidase CysQ [Planctomycetales bacterium]